MSSHHNHRRYEEQREIVKLVTVDQEKFQGYLFDKPPGPAEGDDDDDDQVDSPLWFFVSLL